MELEIVIESGLRKWFISLAYVFILWYESIKIGSQFLTELASYDLFYNNSSFPKFLHFDTNNSLGKMFILLWI